MTIKGSRIEIKELSAIRVLSDDGINPSEMDSVVGGHGYYGHHGYHGYHGYYDYIYKYVQDYVKGFFEKEMKKPEQGTEPITNFNLILEAGVPTPPSFG